MDPFIVDPATYDKWTALAEAGKYVEAFLDLNGLEHPREYLFAPDDSKKPPGKNPWHDNGWHWNNVIFVNVKKSRTPVRTPGFQWSYTGFKADLTAPGILAHELGHHVHSLVDRLIDAKHRQIMLFNIREIAKREPPVSGYEPNAHEIFAEAMRLFILNPNLLRVGRPIRYGFIHDIGLKPLHNADWREVLRNAHPRLISAAEKWIAK